MSMDQNEKTKAIEACYQLATQCGAHPDCVPWKLDDVEEVLHAGVFCNCGWGDAMCGTYCDTGSVALVRLKDGKFGTVYEDSDTTGHG